MRRRCSRFSPSTNDRLGDGCVPRRFGATPRLFWAPGRVNLIGDHIDYCGGAVLPMPIQFGTIVAVRLTRSGAVRAIEHELRRAGRIDVAGRGPQTLPRGSWGRFVKGAIAVLADEGVEIPGADVLVGGDIPGSGLSSSASLTRRAHLRVVACLGEQSAGAAATRVGGAARRTRIRRRAMWPDGSSGDRAGA